MSVALFARVSLKASTREVTSSMPETGYDSRRLDYVETMD